MVFPCKDQTKSWSENDIKIYEAIKSMCDKYVYLSENYYDGCMLKRNRHLVYNSSCCICYLNKDTGGTAYTVRYARQRGLLIYNLARDSFIKENNINM